jgi:hypothetical protein
MGPRAGLDSDKEKKMPCQKSWLFLNMSGDILLFRNFISVYLMMILSQSTEH